MADESFSAERNKMELRPANSMQGFLSVSLRVPSSDPLPLEPTAIPLRTVAAVEHRPHESHVYSVLEDEDDLPATKKESGGEKREGGGMSVGLNPDNRMNLRDATHINTPKPLGASLPQRAKSGKDGCDNRRLDEDGYDTVEREQTLDIKYDDVTLPERPALKNRHAHDTLEDNKVSTKDDGYSITQTHMLVMPDDSNTEGSNAGSSERGVVMGADSINHSMSRGDSVKNSMSLKKDTSADPGYDAPWVSHFPVPRRVTHSNTTKAAASAGKDEPFFDDPTYTITRENFDNASCGLTKEAPPPSNGSSHPRTRSLMQTQHNPTRNHRDNYETTAGIITAGDVSELEPLAGEETTASLPTSKASKRDVYESTSIGLFDDPAYDVGLNLKK